jgi:hypothetical protein
MISKIKLQSVINKYYLNGLIEAVKWEIKDNKLTIRYTSPNKEMLGELVYDGINLPDSTVGISNTSQLLKLLSIASGDVLLDYTKNGKVFSKFIISDNQFTVNYTLADILTIPKTGIYNGSEEYNLEANMDSDSLNALIKAKSALPESTTVVLKPFKNMDGEPQIEFMFGGDIEYANKVSYYLPNVKQKDVPFDFEIGFSSDILKEILSANKDTDKAKISINLEGLMKLEFEEETTKSTYYIVKKDI